jgi:protocatechuate 3,4-dioxygenase beta subunit
MTSPKRALRLAAVLVTAAATLTVAPSAVAEAATVSGTITDAGSGAPIPNVCVVAGRTDYTVVGWTCTDTAGHYAFTDLEAGTAYVFSASPPDPYLATWLPRNPEAGPPQSFVAPATVDAALTPAIRISGTLRAEDGSPASGASVHAELADGSDGRLVAFTDSDGAWSSHVAPGTYLVAFDYAGRRSYAFGKTDRDIADPIVVGTSPVVVNDTMPPAAPPTSVAGRVTDAATGEPVTDVCATLEKEGDPAGYGFACTDADGSYLIADALPGRWSIRVEDEQGRYATARTAAFDLAKGQQVTGRDVKLAQGGTLTGLAVDQRTGAPLAGICPSAFAGRRGAYLRAKQTCSDATGRWSVAGLPAGKTTVQLGGDETHVAMWARNATTQATATQFTVTAGASTDAGTVRLRHGGVVTGRVTNRAGQPVAGAWVELGGYNFRCGVPCGQYAGRTGADGRYRIENVPPRTTIAGIVAPGQPYATQWSGGATDPALARRLSITYDRTTRLDAVLAPEAELTVTVSGIAPDEWAQVDALTLSGTVGWSSEVHGPGTVTLARMPRSQVKLRITTGSDEAEVFTWYGGTSLRTARKIAVAPGRSVAVTVAVPS